MRAPSNLPTTNHGNIPPIIFQRPNTSSEQSSASSSMSLPRQRPESISTELQILAMQSAAAQPWSASSTDTSSHSNSSMRQSSEAIPLAPLPASSIPSSYLLAEHLEFFESAEELVEPTYGVIGLESFYRIYIAPHNCLPAATEQSATNEQNTNILDHWSLTQNSQLSCFYSLFASFFSSPQLYLQSWLESSTGDPPIRIHTQWEVDSCQQFVTAKVDFSSIGEPLVKRITRSNQFLLSFYYNPMIRNTIDGGYGDSPSGTPIKGCPRSIILESRTSLEDRQCLTRTQMIGRGHFGVIYTVQDINNTVGALKEIQLPYLLHRARLDEKIKIYSSFSHTFHTDDRNPFGNSHNLGLEHLLRLPSPRRRAQLPLQPEHPHIAQLHSAFVDPVSKRAHFLMEYYEGGDMDAFLDLQAEMKESRRKEDALKERFASDRRERREYAEQRKRSRQQRRMRLDPSDDDEEDVFDDVSPQATDSILPQPAFASARTAYHLPAMLVRSWAIQFCFALVSLKSHGIVHADIAPRNIFFKDATNVHLVLGDFSMARRVEPKPEVIVDLGQFRAIAPELSKSRSDGCPCGQEPSFASDVWAFGAIILRCMLLLGSGYEDPTFKWSNWSEPDFFHWIDQQARTTTYPSSMWTAVKCMLRVDPALRSTAEQAMPMWVAVTVPDIEVQAPPSWIKQQVIRPTPESAFQQTNTVSGLFTQLATTPSNHLASTQELHALHAAAKARREELKRQNKRPDHITQPVLPSLFQTSSGASRTSFPMLPSPPQNTREEHVVTIHTATPSTLDTAAYSPANVAAISAISSATSSSGPRSISPPVAAASSSTPTSYFEFDVHPPQWRPVFAFLDYFMPSSMRTLRPSTLDESTVELFFDAPKMLFQLRFCIAFTVLQLMVGLLGICYQFIRKVDPHLHPTHSGPDYLAVGGVIIFIVYCASFLIYLKFFCRSRSIHPWIGNGTVLQEIMLLIYATYESAGVGLSFYLVLFSIPTMCFLLLDWKSGVVWQTACFILVLVLNIRYRIDDSLSSAENPPTLQTEHDVLLPVSIFLLIFLLVVNFVFARYQSILHTHLKLALRQLTVQNDFITRTSMSKMRFLNRMSQEIEMPLTEMMETLNQIIQQNNKRRSKSSKRALRSANLPLPQSQSLSFAYLNSVRLQAMIRDMIDVSVVEHYKHEIAINHEPITDRVQLDGPPTDSQLAMSDSIPTPPKQLFPFHDQPINFIEIIEASAQSLALEMARSSYQTSLDSNPSAHHLSAVREVLFEFSPLIHRDARFIGDPQRLTRVFRSLIKNVAAWSLDDSAIFIKAYPRSFGFHEVHYVYLETSILFRPNYAALGRAIHPHQFGLWNFQHPADDINHTIIEHMKGFIWMNQLNLPPPSIIPQEAHQVNQLSSPASLHLILKLPLIMPFNAAPTVVSSIYAPTSQQPAASDRMVPSVADVIYHHSVVPAQMNAIATTSTIPEEEASADSSTNNIGKYLHRIEALIIHSHTDGRLNLAARLALFGVKSCLASNGLEALHFLQSYRAHSEEATIDPPSVENSLPSSMSDLPAPPSQISPPISYRLDSLLASSQSSSSSSSLQDAISTSPSFQSFSRGSRARLLPMPRQDQKYGYAYEEKKDEESDDGEESENAPLVGISSIPGAIPQQHHTPLEVKIPTGLSTDEYVVHMERNSASSSSSLIVFVEMRLPGSTPEMAAIGGIEFIFQLVERYPHWLHDDDKDVSVSSEMSTSNTSSSGLPSPPSDSSSDGGLVSTFIPCPQIIVLTSWSPGGPLIDGLECAQMNRLAQLPLQRPIRFLMTPTMESDLFDICSSVAAEVNPTQPIRPSPSASTSR